MDRLYGLTGSTRTWYASDALGSVRQTLNDSGSVLGAQHYDPWGTPQRATLAPFGFTGELQQGGSVYLRARWYNTSSGALFGRDPWKGWEDQPMSLAPYLYSFNNPINRRDPTGLASRPCMHVPSMISNQPSQCAKMIATIRAIVAAAKTSDNEETLYRGVFGYSRSLWKDTIVTVLGEYYAGLSRTGTMATVLDPFSGLAITQFMRDRSVERHTFATYWDQQQTPGNRVIPGITSYEASRLELPRWSAGEGACSWNNENQVCPSAELQLDYGFKRDYWSNSHHFFGFFWLGYRYGFAAQFASFPQETIESVFRTTPDWPNGVDLIVGERGARLGFIFGLGFLSPDELINRLEAEMCLSPSEIAELRSGQIDTDTEGGIR